MDNYMAMDRASEAAVRDLMEVRKLIEGMNAFANQQPPQQQTNPQSLSRPPPPPPPITTTSVSPPLSNASSLPQQQQQHNLTDDPNLVAFIAAVAVAAAAAAAAATTPTAMGIPTTTAPATTPTATPNDITAAAPAPVLGIILQVEHLTFNQTLYFQLTADATIVPLVATLRMSFNDSSISGMVLQYKAFDGLWKCFLNRDSSLRRILKQAVKHQAMLQMRVPREHDLLTPGYADQRLLVLTKPAA